MTNIENVKKDHHFVFQRYMEEWLDSDKNVLWILREKKKIFSTGTAGVAFKKNFYMIKNINEEEKKLLGCYVATMHPIVQEQMNIIIEAYLLPIKNREMLDEMKRVAIAKFGSEDKIPSDIKSNIENCEKTISIQFHNTMEDYYCGIEGELASYFKQIKHEGIDFYYRLDNNEKYLFLFDICIQYYRTMALKERWVKQFGNDLGLMDISRVGIDMSKVDLNNLSFFYFWHMQSVLAYSLMNKGASVTLLCNDTSLPFITSDQPIINLKCDYCNDMRKTTELELYYPISPSKALLINSTNKKRKLDTTKDEVVIYNKAMSDASKQFIIGNDKKVLEQFIE